MLYIAHSTLYTPYARLDDAALIIDDQRILQVGPTASIHCPPAAQVIDATGLVLIPGFIDLQLNGAFGLDFTADPKSIWEVAECLPQFGVTSFLPTIITSPLERIAAAQSSLCSGRPDDFRGALPLGLHVEGPFLSPGKRGAHNPAYLRQPDLSAVANWTRAAGVWLVTLAPELPGAIELIQHLRDQGVVVSAGHSLASYEEARAGLRAGITYGTHLFNAMPTLEHRAPGLAAALLTDSGAVVGLIPDGIHVHPALVKLVWQAKGAEGINVVSDAMSALGMPPGAYQLGDFSVTVDATSARLSDGRLAGSTLGLDEALRKLIEYTGCSIAEAVTTMTTVPAGLLGLSDRGQIAPGAIADLILLDNNLKIIKTIVRGYVKFQAG